MSVVDLSVGICAVLSYALGTRAILFGQYRPSIYSRAIWMLFAFNNLAGVLLLQNNQAVLVLAGISAAGNLLIFLLSLSWSDRRFGATEMVTTALLALSVLVWLFTRLPLLNLTIGFVAHFLGGVPTLQKVIARPDGEDTLFWLLFFLASALALIPVDWSSASSYLYPLYFTIFDGVMTLLCLRQYRRR